MMPRKKRIQALEQFKGTRKWFAIAMKDLEIRGAGDLLEENNRVS
jgi:transcription-repair coupling factor (superfamily II helicase)